MGVCPLQDKKYFQQNLNPWKGLSQMSLSFSWSCPLMTQSLLGRSLRVFSICLCHCLSVGQIMSPHHFDQITRSLLGRSLRMDATTKKTKGKRKKKRKKVRKSSKVV